MSKEIIGHTGGSWDMFHVGHLNMLKRSKELVDYLIAAVSTDELIASYKGAPPVIPFEQRLEIVSSIKYVDLAIKQTTLTGIDQLKEYNVDVVTIGDDWTNRYLEGLEWMKDQGKSVYYLPYTQGISTTSIKRKIINSIYEIIEADLRRELEKPEEFKQKQHEQSLVVDN